jgi:hypothetical protein
MLMAACLWAAFRYIQFAVAGQPLYGFFAVFLVPLAFGLWLLNPAARVLALAVLWFVVFVVPLGTINPFAAMDELGPSPPPLWELLVFWVAPWVVPSLFAIHVLGKYKSEFRWRRGAAA